MFRIKPVYAHCDVPCGIYETDTMTHAADTCLRMIEKIEALPKDNEWTTRNNFVRMIVTKEKHAAKCKEQLYILWSDYFKSEHLERFPDLHDKFWTAVKQCSTVKQTVSREECAKLQELVGDIAKMFADSKK